MADYEEGETAGEQAIGGRRALPGVIVFIFADIASFVLFFAVFMSERLGQPELFAQSARRLDADLGLLNTMILITSGWLVALAVLAARRGDMAAVRPRLIGAILIGLGFAVVKFIEYGAKLDDGITITTNLFYTYYYALTGLHFIHVVVGLVLLGIIAAKTSRPPGNYMTWLESGALYWHMVDILWVFLFPLFYLQGMS